MSLLLRCFQWFPREMKFLLAETPRLLELLLALPPWILHPSLMSPSLQDLAPVFPLSGMPSFPCLSLIIFTFHSLYNLPWSLTEELRTLVSVSWKVDSFLPYLIHLCIATSSQYLVHGRFSKSLLNEWVNESCLRNSWVQQMGIKPHGRAGIVVVVNCSNHPVLLHLGS